MTDRPQPDELVDWDEPADALGGVSLPWVLLALLVLLLLVGVAVSGLAGALGAGSVNVIIRPQ